jgi:hypothetical protein
LHSPRPSKSFGIEQYAAVWAAAILPLALVGYVLAHLIRSSLAFDAP